ncbi:MAG: sugar ABC transporter permease [Treponema sp.]|nr:sugar ABC transporter permease [Treponema sp.]
MSRGGGTWIIPALIAMSIIQFFPGFLSIIMGFTNLGVTNIRNIGGVKFIGLTNFVRVFTAGTAEGNAFLTSMMGTLVYTFCSAVFGYLLGLGLALLLNQEFPGRSIVRALMIVPWIVPNVVSAFIWRLLYMSEYGVINKVLRKTGLIQHNIVFLINELALPSLIVAHIWSALPFMMISLLAGLQTIPHELYEACKIDGGNVFHRFRHVTMPGIALISTMIFLLSFIRGSGEFTLPYVLYGNAPPPGMANLISVLVYQTSFAAWEFGRGAAMSTVILIIMMFFAIIYMRATVLRKKV